jgi:hypothetical protein
MWHYTGSIIIEAVSSGENPAAVIAAAAAAGAGAQDYK